MLKQCKSNLFHFSAYAFFAASASLLAAGVAIAAGTTDVPVPDANTMEVGGFLNFDTNRDGYIDAKEAAVDPVLAKAFVALDVDNDQRLSLDEFNMGVSAK